MLILQFQESKKGSKDQESLLSVKLSPNQVSILKDFGRSGNPAVLRDVNDILSAQVTSYYPPICADDMFQKIYGAKEFFSQSVSSFWFFTFQWISIWSL